jgi:signal transduction histidine kinase/DNA-binding response OmpR family regulator/ligand-binding sensor domain-containing protein
LIFLLFFTKGCGTFFLPFKTPILPSANAKPVFRNYLIQALCLGWTLLFLQGPSPSHAQEYLANVRQFTTAEGLSNDQVLSLLQDKEGFIWVGTKYGLNRFDGHEFRTFTKESHGLQSNVINQLIEGPGGYIWIIRSQESYGKYDYYSIDLLDPAGETVDPWEKRFPSLPFSLDQVKRIHDVPGGILFRVKEQGFYLLDNSDNSFKTVRLPADFQFISAPEKGHFFGQSEGAYITFDLDAKEVRSFRLKDSLVIEGMVPDHEGNYWCLAGRKFMEFNTVRLSKLLKVDRNGNYTEEDQLDHSSMDIFFTAYRNGHSLLFIHPEEIREYDLDKDRVLTNRNVLESRSIAAPAALLVDQNDALWIGDYFGLRVFSLELSRFSTYLKDQEEPLSARGMTLKGNELIYTYPASPHFLDLNTGRIKSIEEDKGIMKLPAPFSVLRMENDHLVFGGKQLIEVDDQYRIQKASDLSELGGNRIWSFTRDREGRYWIGFGNEHIVVLEPDLESYRLASHNGNEDVGKATKWHFYEDGNYIWIAAQNGLYLVHKEKGVIAQFGANAEEDHYLPAIIFHYIHKDRNGLYWLATGDGGLIRFSYNPDDPGSLSYKQYKKKDGLPSQELYAILEDEKGGFWISTANGLVHFHPETEEVFVFYDEQGITHNEFNRLSYYQHTDGRIFYGGLNGVTAFDPKDFYGQGNYEVPLKVSAASLFSFGSDSLENIQPRLLEDGQLRLRPRDNFLTIKFSLQDYFYSNQVQYSYRISGVRDQWTPMADNTLQLSGLPYGSHRLEVRARGRMNKVSSSVLQMELIVLRPFYLRWWFIALTLLTVAISVWQYTSWRNQSLVRRKQALERIVAERTKKIQEDKQLIEEQAKQLRELDEMKSQFFENVSHELRTPLTLILGPLEKVLKRNKLENRDFTLLSLMKDNAKSLHKRINELLDLSRIDAVRMTLHPEPVALYSFVKNILAQFEGGAKLRSVQLLFEYKLDRDLWVVLDPDKVEKVLYNLLSNAIKFTPGEGEVKLIGESEAGQLVFRVSDTGIGMAEADLPRIFERFHRAKTDEHYEGTGIGLSLCKELTELMGGQIVVSSVQGAGSVFEVKLPLQETFEQPTALVTDGVATDISDLSEEVSDISGDPVLVVEDNPSLREYLRLTLEDFHVKTAGHGQEALNILEEGFQPALIITDIMMPVMDGMELLKTIREKDAYRTMPVIMLTAKTGSTDKVEALRVGVDDYLVKPFVEEELIARVKAVIRNSRQRMKTNSSASGGVSLEESAPVISKADLKWLEEVEKMIMAHVGDKMFGIDQLAEELQMSTRRVQQKVKAITGMTPKQYQREIQLASARRLLEAGDFQSVAEVSRQMGFSDAHYFSKLYEKRFGKRPSEY